MQKLQDEKQKKEDERKRKVAEKEIFFYSCKDTCVGTKPNGKRYALGLCFCSECRNIMKSDCGKVLCKNAGRTMTHPACYKATKKWAARKVDEDLDDDDDRNDDEVLEDSEDNEEDDEDDENDGEVDKNDAKV